jgi:hypothetical protein
MKPLGAIFRNTQGSTQVKTCGYTNGGVNLAAPGNYTPPSVTLIKRSSTLAAASFSATTQNQ